MNYFRDPYLWGDIAQGEWSSNHFYIQSHVLCSDGEEGSTVFSVPAEVVTVGIYRLRCTLTNAEGSGVGLRPIVGDDSHAVLDTDGAIDVGLTVTGLNNDLIGFRNVGGSLAQIAGPIILEKIA
jgi:hypothetical protein